MERKIDIFDDLKCGEVSHIWMGYQYESLHFCGITFFLQHVDDDPIREILEEGLLLTRKRMVQMEQLFTEYKQLLPKGFDVDSDVNLLAPRLFSDVLYLRYMMYTVQLELINYSLAYRDAMNDYVLHFYHQVITDSINLEFKAKNLAKEKGIYIPTPNIPKQLQNELVKKETFLAGWFGDK